MSDLFQLAMPWWEFVLRAVVVYAVLLAMVRLSGKRTMGQFTPFDMILIVLLGNAVQNSLLGKDTSLAGGLLLAATLIALNWLLGFVTSRSRLVERVVEGVPVVLARDGKLYRDVLRQQLVSEDDFREALRENGEMSLEDVGLALLETSGAITVLRRDGARPPDRAPAGDQPPTG